MDAIGGAPHQAALLWLVPNGISADPVTFPPFSDGSLKLEALYDIGFLTTPKAQFEAARALGGSTHYHVFHVAVPHAIPQIFNGVTAACTSSFTSLAIAEIMVILLSLVLSILSAVRGYVLRWQRGQFK